MSNQRTRAMSERSTAHPSAPEKPLARLCYVDDSRTAAFVMRRMLEPGGYRVDYFLSAEPAVVALIQGDYDLLLTDLKVSSSGMDGDDLIRTLRQSGQPRLSQLPIIVITGSTDAEVLVKAYDAGANQVMTKPVDAEALHSHIRRLLAAGQAPAAAEPQPTRREPEAVPVVTPIQPRPTVADKKEEKTIPLLQVASVPAEGPSAPASGAQPAADAPSPAPTENGPLSMIERAVASHAQAAPPRPPAASAPESARDESRQPRVQPHGQGEEIDRRRPMPASAESARKTEEPVQSRDEVEIIIDPEEFPDHQQGLHGARADSRHEAEPFVFDTVSARVPGRLQRLFSGTTLLTLLVLAALGFAAYEGGRSYFEQGLAVRTTYPETGEIYQSLVVPGQVVSRQQAAIHAARAGRLVAVRVRPGDRVRAGQLLARLDEHELLAQLQQAQAELASAREDIAHAEQVWEGLRRAHEKGTVAEPFVGEAAQKLRVARARASVVMREARDTAQALERQRITAPFAGTVLRSQAEVGRWVTPADPLFVLADETQREIEVQVDATAGGRILAGQVVLVTSDAFPGLEWQERVIRLGGVEDGEGDAGVMKAYISLGTEAPDLRPGQAVDAEIRTAWHSHAIKVPLEALLKRENQAYLAVLEDGRVRMKPVITGIEDFAMVEIRQGLGGEEEIILPRGHLLHDGDRVYRLDGVD